MLIGIIASLLLSAVNLIVLIVQALIAIALAILDFALACLYVVLRALQWALPIVLRAICLVIAVWATLELLLALYRLYDGYLARELAVVILVATLIECVVILLGVTREMQYRFWGVCLICGLLAWAAVRFIENLDANALAVLPATLAVVFNPLFKKGG